MLVESNARNAPTNHIAPVEVSPTLPRSDRGQMRRLFSRNEPLGYGKPGVATHADLAVAPGLSTQPLDQVEAVQAVLTAPEMDIPFRAESAAHVHINDRIAVRAPVARIRTLEHFQS